MSYLKVLAVGTALLLVIFGSALAFGIPPTAPQGQASVLAVPPQAAPVPASVILVVLCNNVIGIIVTDDRGTNHGIPMKGIDKQKADRITQSVPADHVLEVDVGCPGKLETNPI